MKKRINPELFRNLLYSNLLLSNNIIKNRNTNSLIIFQDEELKSNIIQFFKKHKINILDINILRNYNILNIHLYYYNISNFKKKKSIKFLKYTISKLNFLKFYILKKSVDIYNSDENILDSVKKLPVKKYLILKTKCDNNLFPFSLKHKKKKKKLKLYKLALIKNKLKINLKLNNKILFKYYKQKSSNLFLKQKLMLALHLYTGYSTINIFGKYGRLNKKLSREIVYNNILKYTKFYILNLIKPRYNIKKLYLKYKRKKRFFKRIIIKNLRFKKKKHFKLFLKRFPYYLQKKYKYFLSKVYYFLLLKNQNEINKFKFLKNSFKYIYKSVKCHFYRAFKFYKSLLRKIFRMDLLKITGLKLIFKGRFGKVRKQIQKLRFGALRLNTLKKKVTYYNSLLLTKRGSYGFHMWFSSK